MSTVSVIETVLQKLAHLPLVQQQEVLDFVESLTEKATSRPPLFNPEGLWAGSKSDISPEEISLMRREMWGEYVQEEVE
ncbi:MAG: hypothetical protein IT426_14130 [Pirellulales bacterium]|nr:hypothetical protein [Pirellulales bacterium]